uniref:Uncharacterized protein n=1 Tax=Aegilops tauschii TaxID=37682 RepID=M8BL55_AEGTA
MEHRVEKPCPDSSRIKQRITEEDKPSNSHIATPALLCSSAPSRPRLPSPEHHPKNLPKWPPTARASPKPVSSTSRRLLLPVSKFSTRDGSASYQEEDEEGEAEDSAEAAFGDEDDEKPQPEAVSSTEFQFAAPPEGYIEPAPFDELPPESPEDGAAADESLYGPAFSGESLMGNNVFEVKVVDPVDMDREQRPNDEFSERVVQVSRVTKVVKGGRQLSYRALVVVGDMKGHVGVGVGKAKEVSEAITKAAMNGRRNLVTVPLTKYCTFPHSELAVVNGNFEHCIQQQQQQQQQQQHQQQQQQSL